MAYDLQNVEKSSIRGQRRVTRGSEIRLFALGNKRCHVEFDFLFRCFPVVPLLPTIVTSHNVFCSLFCLLELCVILSTMMTSRLTSVLKMSTTASRSAARFPAAPITRLYHERVIDHYNNPRNVGKFTKEELKDVGTGLVGAPACGDVMKLQLKIVDGVVEDAKFKTFGCGSAIASSSLATEWVKGWKFLPALSIPCSFLVPFLPFFLSCFLSFCLTFRLFGAELQVIDVVLGIADFP